MVCCTLHAGFQLVTSRNSLASRLSQIQSITSCQGGQKREILRGQTVDMLKPSGATIPFTNGSRPEVTESSANGYLYSAW